MIRFLAVLAFAASGTALAATATVTRYNGNVMANEGEQFRPVQVGQVLSTGDRVMVPQGGSAHLSFDDGCDMDVQGNTLVTIPAMSTCKGGTVVSQQVTPGSAAGSGPYYGGRDSMFGWGYIGAVVAITAYMISRDDDDDEDDDDTASP